MSVYPIQPVTLAGVRTYPIATRESKVSVSDLASPTSRGASFTKFLDSLPKTLAAQDLRELGASIHAARRNKRAILWGIGGHVIKVGLAPVLIDLIEKGFVSGIAMNGAALIHDFELAMAGGTSEDVEAALGKGQFGMAEETGWGINEIAKLGQRIRIGYGEAAGQYLTSGIVEPQVSRTQPYSRRLQKAHSPHHSFGDWHRYSSHASFCGWCRPRRRFAPRFQTFLCVG